jgi:ABC-type antimicrobial peptide transport system permease subunit
MNWHLVSRDEDGELNISFILVCLIIVLCGFLFGIGFSMAFLLVDTMLNKDGLVFQFISDNRIFTLVVIGLCYWATYLLIRANNKKGEKDEKG